MRNAISSYFVAVRWVIYEIHGNERISRRTFWLKGMLPMCTPLILWLPILLHTSINSPSDGTLFVIASVILRIIIGAIHWGLQVYSLAMIYFAFVLCVKRWHDFNQNGAGSLIGLVSVFAIFLSINEGWKWGQVPLWSVWSVVFWSGVIGLTWMIGTLGFRKGTLGKNRYGLPEDL